MVLYYLFEIDDYQIFQTNRIKDTNYLFYLGDINELDSKNV